MTKKLELLAPGGDVDSIKAAIAAGADAVYCGLDKFNARNRATNIRFDNLQGIIHLAHAHHCQVFLTLNIIIVESEIPALINLLNKIVNTRIDGIIVQDIGMLYLLSHWFKGLKVHASTQLTTHNEGQIAFLKQLAVTRVNLSRELNLDEISRLTRVAHRHDIATEVFVHGSNCICFSGICYMSSVISGNSGNRGRCSQPCRDQYRKTSTGMNFPLNLKDNSAYLNLRELSVAGVDSLKIEGRIKKSHYVYTVVDAWRKQLDRFYGKNTVNTDMTALYKVFNRDFTNAYLHGNISNDMFIDNPRDNSAIHVSELKGTASAENIEEAKCEIYDERTGIITTVEQKLAQLSIDKALLHLHISGDCGEPLKISVQTPDTSFDVLSSLPLAAGGSEALTIELLTKRLKALNDTPYYIKSLDTDNLRPNLFLPFRELTTIKKRVLFLLNNANEWLDPIDIPAITRLTDIDLKPKLSVLISSRDDIPLCNSITATIYFQIPACLKKQLSGLQELFVTNTIIPWFPSVLIGDDYRAAVELLKTVHPKHIVTNNTGIAYEAWKLGIAWITGPHLNNVNSWSLRCLKEQFNCAGAFISNELNKVQIKGIKKPADFDVYYSIYHPMMVMTSRQCLLQQVTGCSKHHIDDDCLQNCVKRATITNIKNNSFVIEKSKGNYHELYNGSHFLNTDIVTDIPDMFSSFFIDLRRIQTATQTKLDIRELCTLFEKLLQGDSDAKQKIGQALYPTTSVQYKTGI